MGRTSNALEAQFSKAERAYIRRELDQILSSLPRVADGFLLKTWKTGTKAGQPKLPPPAETLVAKGLMEVRPAEPWPRLFFTPGGLNALRRMMSDARLADPRAFAHVRAELGIDRQGEDAAPMEEGWRQPTNVTRQP